LVRDLLNAGLPSGYHEGRRAPLVFPRRLAMSRRHRRRERLHKLRDAQVERVANPSLTHVVDRNIATIARLRD
jgi:hypothetical protein